MAIELILTKSFAFDIIYAVNQTNNKGDKLMNYKNRRIGSLILGLLSASGTVLTAILVAKETPSSKSPCPLFPFFSISIHTLG